MANNRWCFTLNNYSQEEEDQIKAIECKYIVFGHEIGEQGTPHLQGFIILNKRVRFSSAKGLFPERTHLEIARGTSPEAADYCLKYDKDNFYERGVRPLLPGEGEKKRWADARECAKRGDFDNIPPDIYIRYLGNLKKIHSDAMTIPAPVQTLDFHWYYGSTGTGKSSTARSQNPNYYLKGINKWWDGYTDQPCVIIEEWSPMDNGAERIMGHYLKQWCDHHCFQAEFKGGMKMIRPPKIIITSNYSMEECFTDPNILDPLKRRIRVTQFHNYFNPSPIYAPNIICSPTQEQNNNNEFSLFS